MFFKRGEISMVVDHKGNEFKSEIYNRNRTNSDDIPFCCIWINKDRAIK